MPAKIITLSQKDMDFLRAALNYAEREANGHAAATAVDLEDAVDAAAFAVRIKDLKERIL